MSEEFPTPQLLNELEDVPPPTPYGRVVKDIFAGTMGGVAQVLVGQPFDTTKVRLQTSKTKIGVIEVVQNLLRNEGALAFYKGMLTPLLGVGICVSVQFGVNESMKRFFAAYNADRVDPQKHVPLPLHQYYLCGLTGGVVNSFLAAPIEHVRIRLQTQTSQGNERQFKGPFDCIKKLAKAKALMRGLLPTMIRAGHGLGTYFAAYEALVVKEFEKGTPRNQIPAWKLCSFGALSGTILWLTVYPVDVVKSVLQTDSIENPKYKNSIIKATRALYKQHGIPAFFKGFVPTMIRAAPANAATFVSFEMTMRVLG
ncbi:uncharacterized protein GVI51_K12045 [Nakaseomyces glabratus]|uniref:Carrier protein YMC1, mitochondrial n=2 Tax=Candida glabrata TaxID=5478 RepID=Q6FLZ8_CANGA|nr:uncharacterized protein CAGL0K12210g [Nakaseomyces glabratus]KAH7582523.1 Mitochondrial carrier protein [Nakaseomyces glabratus]KAH7583431.1 Mitochondrial carrier protein [Nakaseomyces glabratus]KAH7584854.1 Mitochondrial carrier protein [Nakaseomyces glabratus]KAH7596455.1 Mitochondrial carrier protein [Nakaseomyces glabratus]KAH7597314.1 Mitochondrial carrier protein [Nakaseomyces glabratus]|eukprot:XP_448746.1 uncharacterized protein CAGL0K12210g [[Candida] glabrata]